MSKTLGQTSVFTQESSERLVTKSRLRAWWLVTVRGYRRGTTSHVPKVGPFGRITYTRKWVLHPPTE